MAKEKSKIILLLTPHANGEVKTAVKMIINYLTDRAMINTFVMEIPRSFTTEDIIRDYHNRWDKTPAHRISLEQQGELLIHAQKKKLDILFGDIERTQLSKLQSKYHKETGNLFREEYFSTALNADKLLIKIAHSATHPFLKERSKDFSKEILAAYKKGGVLAEIGNSHGDIIDLLYKEIAPENIIPIFVKGYGAGELTCAIGNSRTAKLDPSNHNTIEKQISETSFYAFARSSFNGHSPMITSYNGKGAGDIFNEMKNIIEASDAAHSLKERLEEQGYQLVDVSRHGNCFYEAVALQIGPEMEQQDIRGIAALQIESHPEEFENFLSEGSTIITEIANAIVPGVWADHIQIQAVSNALNINLLIHTVGGDRFITPTNTQNFDQITYHLFYDGSHYMAAYTPSVRAQNFDNIFHSELPPLHDTYDTSELQLLHNTFDLYNAYIATQYLPQSMHWE